jgi:hypothetical protein
MVIISQLYQVQGEGHLFASRVILGFGTRRDLQAHLTSETSCNVIECGYRRGLDW